MTRHQRANRLQLRIDHDGRVGLLTCPDCVPGPVEALALLDMVREHLLPMVAVQEKA